MTEVEYFYIQSMRPALIEYYDDLGKYRQAQGHSPHPSSLAMSEHSTSGRPESIITALSIANYLIEAAGEHVTAFVKTISEPVEPIACWTCVRSMLESCAISTWLLDPTIDARERVGRVFAYRYEGMDQALKMGRADGMPQSEIDAQKNRIDTVERDAIALGYPRIQDRKERRIGIGTPMPSATDIIKNMLDEEILYRLLSAVAHGHEWALRKLSFKPASDPATPAIGGVAVTHFEKTVSFQGVAVLGITASKAIGKAFWFQCQYCGWDEARLVGIFEKTFDALQAAPGARFWR